MRRWGLILLNTHTHTHTHTHVWKRGGGRRHGPTHCHSQCPELGFLGSTGSEVLLVSRGKLSSPEDTARAPLNYKLWLPFAHFEFPVAGEQQVRRVTTLAWIIN